MSATSNKKSKEHQTMPRSNFSHILGGLCVLALIPAAAAPHQGALHMTTSILQTRAQALHKRWAPHTVYSSGVHYNALGNELIAGAVLTQLGFWQE